MERNLSHLVWMCPRSGLSPYSRTYFFSIASCSACTLLIFLFSMLQEEIFASSFAAAAYLKSIKFPSDKKVGSRDYHVARITTLD